MSRFLQRYLDAYGEHDDIDSIAYHMRSALERSARESVDGLLEMLEHPAQLEIDAFDTIVAYPPLLDAIAERATAAQAHIASEVVPRLRALESSREPGVRQRALYALVRLLGPEAPEVSSGLTSRAVALEAAVLCGLTDGTSHRLPETLAAPLAQLIERGRGRGKGADGYLVFERPLVLAALRLPEPGPLVLLILEDTRLRTELAAAIEAAPSRPDLSIAMGALVARFELAASRIERPEGALPERTELSIASSIASIVGRQPDVARRAASIFDSVVGVARTTGQLRPGSDYAPITALCRVIASSIDVLPAEALLAIAAHLAQDHAAIFGVAAKAWVLLPSAAATTLAARFDEGRSEIIQQRWDAAAAAYADVATPPATQGELLARHAGAHNLTPALRAALARTAPDPMKLEETIRKARTPAELVAALELAADQQQTSVLRAALGKLREGPFRIDATLEALVARLVGEDDEAWIEAEIEGENPFRDRRDALKRALEAARRSR